LFIGVTDSAAETPQAEAADQPVSRLALAAEGTTTTGAGGRCDPSPGLMMMTMVYYFISRREHHCLTPTRSLPWKVN
jgi:hypothetical protein